MKLLAIHSDFIEFKAKKKAFKKAEEDVSKEVERVEECLVIFTAAESSDEAGAAKVLENYVAEVKSISEQVNCNKIVLYPYAHLSSDLSNPSFALKIMQDAEKELKKSKDYEVYRAPFGWYKSFNISCKGHPLSELSRKIGCEDKKSSLKREYKDEVFAFEAKELDSSDKIKMRAALVLAAVVKKLYPKSEISDCGFYHDQVYLDISGIKLQENNFGALKKQMRKLISAGDKIKKVVSSKVANDLQKDILSDIGKDGVAYGLGDVTIVSRFLGSLSGAVDSIGAFELVSLGSVYWKGNQENKQHMRIRLVAFSDKKGLDDWKQALKEAEDRSHLKIGKEMGLFVQSKLVGSGLPLIAPKGMVIRSEVVDFLWELHKLKGYKRVWTPHIAKKDLYKTSGHWDKFGDELFKVKGKTEEFIMKPMNCPHHMQIFDGFEYSYRDMPIRFFEPATVYRDEKKGQLHGLSRVRAITQDDGHLFCRVHQIKEEVAVVVGVIQEFYRTLGMDKGYWVSLSVRGEDKSKYLGSEKVWKVAEKALSDVAKDLKLPFKRMEGEAAFYGPKLDFMFKDSLGRERQLGTVQCDFNLPERFDLSFVNEKGEKERPVVIHRAISGSLERFMGVIIEHFAGKFPLWLSPEQVRILTVTDRGFEFASDLCLKLSKLGFRVEVDNRTETIGKKVREAQLDQVNYILTVGDKEIDTGCIAVRDRGTGKTEFGVAVDSFLADLVAERDERRL